MDHINSRIDSLIQRIEAGEPINHSREIVLAGLEFVQDRLQTQEAADGSGQHSEVDGQ